MSIANLLVPNDYDLFCDTLTLNDLIINGSSVFSDQTIQASWTGPWAAAQLGDVKFAKSGSVVVAILEPVSDTVTGAASIGANVIPADLRPSNDINVITTRVLSNGANVAGSALIRNSGFINVFGTVAGGDFTAGNSGWADRIVLSWNLL